MLDLHARLKARPAYAGMSMSDYVLREIRQSLDKPTRQEVFARIAALPPIQLGPPPADVLRTTGTSGDRHGRYSPGKR